MFCVICGGVVYILGHATGSQERHICSIHKPLIKSTFPRHFTQTKPKTPLRYTLRQNAHFTPFSPIPTTPKITTIPPKTTSNPYKSILHSNSTKNHIFNNKISPNKPPKSNHKITQNISKINTFQPYQIHKQHYSIEVIFFIIKNHIKIFTLIFNTKREINNVTKIYHPPSKTRIQK